MNLLLDTHTFLWFTSGSEEVPKKLIDLIENPVNKCFVSLVPLWEVSIKNSLRKLNFKSNFNDILKDVAGNYLPPIEF
ncbi:type II toxin-antitoxin system VapC family toxin [Emticicia sp. SJ17W-69]|uniref:type II toxin-antitoxin system VapC family toxin n=1 Tax=Emticicia sp. SJ17W-69 TaxID=3421657 RepID=UPI003EBC8963